MSSATWVQSAVIPDCLFNPRFEGHVLYTVAFFRTFCIIETVERTYKVARYPAYALKAHPLSHNLVFNAKVNQLLCDAHLTSMFAQAKASAEADTAVAHKD